MRDPLAVVRALHAAPAADGDQESLLKSKFAAVIADPALGPQARSARLFERACELGVLRGAQTAPAEAIGQHGCVRRPLLHCRRLPAAAGAGR